MCDPVSIMMAGASIASSLFAPEPDVPKAELPAKAPAAPTEKAKIELGGERELDTVRKQKADAANGAQRNRTSLNTSKRSGINII